MAFQTLLMVEKGGYAADLLFARSAGLESRDAGLASEIALGSLRVQAQLDYLIRNYSGKPPERMDPEVRIALRIGIYQLRYLQKIPAHAAVAESVELVKKARKTSAAGFVNAVLRKVNRYPVPWPDRATELSHPEWLIAGWEAQVGAETARRIALANLTPPETYVRIPPGRKLPCGVVLEPSDVPGCYRVLEGSTEGLRIQDIGSQSVVPLLDLQPGQVFLDLCAAPGNKTAQALESGIRAVACDFHLSRLRPMTGLGCSLVVVNGADPLPFSRNFDRILVDAPCSGTGTLARNPEIKWRLHPEQLQTLHTLQVRILTSALSQLAEGGKLVYSTCSLQSEENEAVVEETTGNGAGRFRVERLWRRLPGVDPGDGFFAAVITSG